jgi:hypothetical protein
LSSPDPNSPVPLVLIGFWRIFAGGFLGGIAGDLLGFADRRRERMPDYYKKSSYWLGAFTLAFFGGLLATFYGSPMNALLALNIGASAPLIIKSASTSVPRIRGSRID